MIVMKKYLMFALLSLGLGFSASAVSLVGQWEGTLSIGPQKIALAFNIAQSSSTQWSVTLDVPAQGAHGIPCEATVGCDNIEIRIAVLNASFSGTITSDNVIKGTFTQHGFNLPLELTKKEDLAQAPIEPLPQLRNEQQLGVITKDGIKISGTLALPGKQHQAPFPAVVLVSGSGTQDRDETILGHKPFREISDYLTRQGIAVLRYDDRGAGKSSPLKGNETTMDFASDAQAVFDCLRRQSMIDTTRMGYIGHSEGGQIAFINAASDKRVAFVVSLAGPAAPGRDVMVQQNLSLLDMQGVTYTQAQVDELRAIFDDIATMPDTTALRNSLRQRLAASTLQRYTPEQLEQSVAVMTSPWYMAFIRFNPEPYLKKITCPVLALNGEWDFQVDATQTFNALKENVKNLTCKLLPKHNHLFQECQSQQESLNYAALGEISRTTLEAIAKFIRGE